ncbi:MAG TPA: helix-turn-helix transcriptional regulator [Gammaproteobacteria bacterium]|jgi:transcriptional regulator with XRE-family HTH domain|nr:helix-turn-helix transcriptional regulator [Gammaproteobacteria bacterium]
MTIGERLRQCRLNKGFKHQMDLALRCGWKNSARICNYEKDVRVPRPRDAEILACVLKTTPSYLIFGVTSE